MKNKENLTGQGEVTNIKVRRLDKDTKFTSQRQIVTDEFKTLPSTMLEISSRTGILRSNICRYVASLRKQERIFFIRKDICSISYHRAGLYTTDLQLFNEIKGIRYE